MRTVQLASSSAQNTPSEDGFDLTVSIITNDEECAESNSCDTSDGCSSTCPSACVSS